MAKPAMTRTAAIAIVVLASLAGCGVIDQSIAHFAGYAIECVDGFQYLIFPQSVTFKYDSTGKVVPCRK